ncbi:MAG TPA: peptidoglycan-binding domain-containing protein [Trebonia sp.]|nr:peptidoglycan-binding domain-containing protein [Trebonia sp.]
MPAAVARPNATLLSAIVQVKGLQPWPVDGAFGPLTRNAVLAFQRAHHLKASGVVGAATWQALIITVHRGSSGPAVRAGQSPRAGTAAGLGGAGPQVPQPVRAR